VDLCLSQVLLVDVDVDEDEDEDEGRLSTVKETAKVTIVALIQDQKFRCLNHSMRRGRYSDP
jgi:hypothetical protein